MAVQVLGTLRGREVEITWSAGQLAGDDAAIAAVHQLLVEQPVISVHDDGTVVRPSLDDALSAAQTLFRALDRAILVHVS